MYNKSFANCKEKPPKKYAGGKKSFKSKVTVHVSRYMLELLNIMFLSFTVIQAQIFPFRSKGSDITFNSNEAFHNRVSVKLWQLRHSNYTVYT